MHQPSSLSSLLRSSFAFFSRFCSAFLWCAPFSPVCLYLSLLFPLRCSLPSPLRSPRSSRLFHLRSLSFLHSFPFSRFSMRFPMFSPLLPLCLPLSFFPLCVVLGLFRTFVCVRLRLFLFRYGLLHPLLCVSLGFLIMKRHAQATVTVMQTNPAAIAAQLSSCVERVVPLRGCLFIELAV